MLSLMFLCRLHQVLFTRRDHDQSGGCDQERAGGSAGHGARPRWRCVQRSWVRKTHNHSPPIILVRIGDYLWTALDVNYKRVQFSGLLISSIFARVFVLLLNYICKIPKPSALSSAWPFENLLKGLQIDNPSNRWGAVTGPPASSSSFFFLV